MSGGYFKSANGFQASLPVPPIDILGLDLEVGKAGYFNVFESNLCRFEDFELNFCFVRFLELQVVQNV